LSDLARALDHQRLALLESRGHFEAERQVVAGQQLVLERERAVFTHDREARQEAIDREIGGLRASLEETHAHLHRKVLALDALEAQTAAVRADAARHEHDLRHARETIARMEQSVFWRLRRFWAGISRAFGRPT
jgi:hypothetical protein